MAEQKDYLSPGYLGISRKNRHLTANTDLHILELFDRHAPNLIAIRCRDQICGRGVAVTQQLPKLLSRVRVPSPAQNSKRGGSQNCEPPLFVGYWYFSAKPNQETERLPTSTCVLASLFTYRLWFCTSVAITVERLALLLARRRNS